MKKTFRVHANSMIYYYIDVEAKNKDEAYDIAVNADGGDFTETIENNDWEVQEHDIEELTSRNKRAY